MKPEEKARRDINEQLEAIGWVVQSREAANLGAARGVAVGEFPLTTGFANYMLFVDKRPIGVIEAKAVGTPLSGVEPQTVAHADVGRRRGRDFSTPRRLAASLRSK
jgi:type I restriction enzyme R subunit